MTNKPMCGRCFAEVDQLVPPECPGDPESLIGQPVGMYHCECGAMVVAGFPHPWFCQKCAERKHPGFDGGEAQWVG